jgi:hypothetical protein
MCTIFLVVYNQTAESSTMSCFVFFLSFFHYSFSFVSFFSAGLTERLTVALLLFRIKMFSSSELL